MTDLTHARFRQSQKELALSRSDDWFETLGPSKLKRADHTKDVCDKIKAIHEEPTISVSVIEGLDFAVPSRFSELAEQIRKSAYILEFEDNWDDEGSTAYSKITLNAAINFVLEYSKAIWE